MDDVVRSLAEETSKPKQEELAPMLDDAVEERSQEGLTLLPSEKTEEPLAKIPNGSLPEDE